MAVTQVRRQQIADELTAGDFAAASVDGVAGTASLRTLGTGSQQAAAGDHSHSASAITAGTLNTSVLLDKGGAVYNAKAYGAFFDGSSHPLSAVYGTLGAAQVDYPTAQALADEFDQVAVEKALAAMPAGGGVARLPGGDGRLTRTLQVGDGTAAANSTRRGVQLVGVGPGQSDTELTPAAAGTRLLWYGPAGGTMVSVNGPISGVGVDGVQFVCNAQADATAAGIGLRVRHAFHSTFHRLQALGAADAAFEGFAYDNPTDATNNCALGFTGNYWTQVNVTHGQSYSVGLRLGAPSSGLNSGKRLDVNQNHFLTCMFRPKTGGNAGTVGVHLGFVDNSLFQQVWTEGALGIRVQPSTSLVMGVESVLSITLNAAAGFVNGETVTITDSQGTGATGTATVAGGTLTAVAVTGAGTGFIGQVVYAAGVTSGKVAVCRAGLKVVSGLVTLAGAGYTSTPTVKIVGGGGATTDAAATVTLGVIFNGATVAAGGTGYSVGNVLTLSGGTSTTTAQLTVSSVSAGVITGVTVSRTGVYTVLPSNPVSVTGGGGSGATFTVSWGLSTLVVSAGGTGYAFAPAVALTGGGYTSVGQLGDTWFPQSTNWTNCPVIGGVLEEGSAGPYRNLFWPYLTSDLEPVPGTRWAIGVDSQHNYFGQWTVAGGMLPPANVQGTAAASGGSLATGTYYFKVVAYDGQGYTVPGIEESVPVTGPTGKVTLQWDGVVGAVSYVVYKGTSSGGQNLWQSTAKTLLDWTSDAGATAGAVPITNNAYNYRWSPTGKSWVNGVGQNGFNTAAPLYGWHQVGGGVLIQQLATPAAPTVATVGTAGATTYTYWVVAEDSNYKTLAGASGATTTGNATLSTTNYNRVSFSTVPGAGTYRVLKKATAPTAGATETILLGSVVAGAGPLYVDDVGQALSSYVNASTNLSATLTAQGPIVCWTGTSGTSDAFAVLDSAGGNAKYIRNSAGFLQFVNAAYTTVILQLSDTGSVAFAAGTTTSAPIILTGGTNLTTPAAGAVEFDGASFYTTADTTNGRRHSAAWNYFRLTGSGTGITTIADFFGANSAIPLVANGVYEVEWVCYFSQATAGTATWTVVTATTALANLTGEYVGSPVGGIGAVGTPQTAGVNVTTSSSTAFPVTGSEANAATHYFRVRVLLTAGNGASNVRLRLTMSAGTATPLINSFFRVRRLPGSNTGAFVA